MLSLHQPDQRWFPSKNCHVLNLTRCIALLESDEHRIGFHEISVRSLGTDGGGGGDQKDAHRSRNRQSTATNTLCT